MLTQEFQDVFPEVQVDTDTHARNFWGLKGSRGTMLAAGVGGPITGHGAYLGIVDDPIENWQQARSPLILARIWEWYRSTFRTRIWEDGSILVVMTRWVQKDLVGRLLETRQDHWRVLRFPALGETQEERDAHNVRLGLPSGLPDILEREPGESIVPSRFSKGAFLELKKDVGTFAWTGEYIGSPTAYEGNMFKLSWFKIVDEAPIQAKRVRYWDKAASPGRGSYTCGLLMARTSSGEYYIEDVVRGQWSPGERDARMEAVAERDMQAFGKGAVRIYVEQEGGSGGLESVQATIQMLEGHSVHADRPSGSKAVRAEPFAAQAEAGNVFVLRRAWTQAYLDELINFSVSGSGPNDQVDASSGAFNKLSHGRVQPLRAEQPTRSSRWGQRSGKRFRGV
jgi:predicted phage terminase large subunit-like protein